MPFGTMFRGDGICQRVMLPGTVGETLLWYKNEATTSVEPELVNLKRDYVDGNKFDYLSCIYDSGSNTRDGDMIVFRTVIPVYTFQTMGDEVFLVETDFDCMNQLVERFRSDGETVM